MKKTLLRFILTAFVGASTLAVSGQTVIQGMTPKNHRGLTQIAAPAKAPMKAHAFNTINDVYGVYDCQWTNNRYASGSGTPSSQVTIVRDESSSNANAILIKNYYAGLTLKATVNLSTKKITIPYQSTGTDLGDGTVWFFMTNYHQIGGNWQPSSFQWDIDATLNSDGSITLDSETDIHGFGFWAKSYGSWVGYYTIQRRAVWSYAGPVVDYTFTSQVDECVHNNKIDLKISAGADVATMKYALLKGDLSTSENVPDEVLETAQPIENLNGSIKIKDKHGLYTLYLLSYDAEDVPHIYDLYVLSIVDDEPGEWEKFCTASYTDDIMAGMYTPFNVMTYDVDVQYNTMRENLIRVVEPYSSSIYDSYNVHECDHPHYLYIDASNPKRVVLLTSPLGFAHENSDDFGLLLCTSKAQMEREKGTSDDDIEALGYFGKMETTSRATENFVITFPQESLVPFFKNNSTKLCKGNINNSFRLELTSPIPTSIKEIGSDDVNAPVVYYNLQGMRINEPAKGQVVIRHQGNKSEKIIF